MVSFFSGITSLISGLSFSPTPSPLLLDGWLSFTLFLNPPPPLIRLIGSALVAEDVLFPSLGIGTFEVVSFVCGLDSPGRSWCFLFCCGGLAP